MLLVCECVCAARDVLPPNWISSCGMSGERKKAGEVLFVMIRREKIFRKIIIIFANAESFNENLCVLNWASMSSEIKNVQRSSYLVFIPSTQLKKIRGDIEKHSRLIYSSPRVLAHSNEKKSFSHSNFSLRTRCRRVFMLYHRQREMTLLS